MTPTGFWYDWGGGNVWLFHAVNNVRGEAIDALMLLGTWLGDSNLFAPYLGLIALVAAVYVERVNAGDPRAAAQPAMAWLGVIAVFTFAYVFGSYCVAWLKTALDFPRPPLALPAGSFHIVGGPEYQNSLPSGHSVFATTLTASLWPLLKRPWRMVMAAFTLWVGLSRISLGLHFPADVVAGYLVGLSVVVATRALMVSVLRALRPSGFEPK